MLNILLTKLHFAPPALKTSNKTGVAYLRVHSPSRVHSDNMCVQWFQVRLLSEKNAFQRPQNIHISRDILNQQTDRVYSVYQTRRISVHIV